MICRLLILKFYKGWPIILCRLTKLLPLRFTTAGFPTKKRLNTFALPTSSGAIIRFQWELRSADDRIIDAAEQAVEHSPSVSINRHPCEVLSYEVREKRFCADSTEFKMNTPIVVYHTEQSGFVRYYNPFETEFFERVSNNIKNKYEMFCGKPLPGDVIIECSAPSGRDKCVTRYEQSIINAWYGKYRVTADPEVLDFIWHTGLGSKNSMGFGTVSEP